MCIAPPSEGCRTGWDLPCMGLDAPRRDAGDTQPKGPPNRRATGQLGGAEADQD